MKKLLLPIIGSILICIVGVVFLCFPDKFDAPNQVRKAIACLLIGVGFIRMCYFIKEYKK